MAGVRASAVPVMEEMELVECTVNTTDDKLAEALEELGNFVEQLVP